MSQWECLCWPCCYLPTNWCHNILNPCSLSPLGILSEMLRKVYKFWRRVLAQVRANIFNQLNIVRVWVCLCYSIGRQLRIYWYMIYINISEQRCSIRADIGLCLRGHKKFSVRKIKWRAKLEVKRLYRAPIIFPLCPQPHKKTTQCTYPSHFYGIL